MLVQDFDVVADQFLGRERVQPAADGIHRPGDLFRRAVLGALEHHMLDKVGKAGLVQFFLARAGADPQANRNAADMRHSLGDDAYTVGQNLALDFPGFALMKGLGRAPCAVRVIWFHLTARASEVWMISWTCESGCSAKHCRNGSCRYRGSPWSEASPDSAPVRSIKPFTASELPICTAFRRLPKALRDEFPVGIPEVDRQFDSTDGTRRYLLKLADGKTVETVWMPEGERSTVCISTQVGCPVDCKFCLTALLGLERNLTAGEIVGQVLRVAADRGLEANVDRLNIVMMGQGEPLLNLKNVIKATRLLTDPEGMAISPRRITLSTSGIIPKIRELAREEVRPKLAISLNASTEEQRQTLMPITRKYHLSELIDACRDVSSAAVGEADLRVRDAERRERHRRGRPPRRETAGEPEREGELDRAKPGSRDSIRDARSAARRRFSEHRAPGTSMLHPQASWSGCVRRLRTAQADGTGRDPVGEATSPANGARPAKPSRARASPRIVANSFAVHESCCRWATTAHFRAP